MGNAIVVAILAVIGFFWWKQRQATKAEVWEGVVSDKQEHTTTDSEGHDTDWYYFDITLSDGSTKKQYEVNKKVYKSFSIGDKIIKRAGEVNPTQP